MGRGKACRKPALPPVSCRIDDHEGKIHRRVRRRGRPGARRAAGDGRRAFRAPQPRGLQGRAAPIAGPGPDNAHPPFRIHELRGEGLDYVMRGLAQLKRETGQPVPLLFIVGRGNEGQYRRLAEELDIGANVRFSGSRDGRTSTPSTWEAISSPCYRASTPSAWRPSMPWPHRFRLC